MTGYGKIQHEDAIRRISAEISAVNSKYADVTLQLPKVFANQELVWKNLVIAQLQRGKITLSITYELKASSLPRIHINQDLFKEYYATLQSLVADMGVDEQPTLSLVMQFPGVVAKIDPNIGHEEDGKIVQDVIQDALCQCDQYRQTEGTALARVLVDYVQAIRKSLAVVHVLDPERSEAMHTRLRENVRNWVASHAIDDHRMTQELVYYLERLDITEEKTRLQQHLDYFEASMQGTQPMGKKLGFIAQEIGREINTMGAKAHNAVIQKEVVLMKDALEKIKEQLLNIL